MDPVTVWVLAQGDDPGLPVLDEAPAGARFIVGDGPEAFRDAPSADAVLLCSAGREDLERVLAIAPRLRWVHSRSAGVDGLLFPGFARSPIPLTNARGVFSAALAEFAVGAVLFFAKGFRRMLARQAAGAWDPFEVELVAGRTLGIVGYGDVGRAVARLARGLGMRVLALRRRPELSREDPLVDEALAPERLPELLARSGDVVVTAPLTPETRGLLGPAEIAAMKPSVVLVNVGRGPVVDEVALVRALQEGRIRGAALDVFETEPLPAGHPFYRLENVLLSPHCADHTRGWLEGAMRFFLENLARFRSGQPLLNLVDKARGY